MSTIKSSTEHLTLNADGSGKEIKFQANGTEKAKITSTGVAITGNLELDDSTGTTVNRIRLGTGNDLGIFHDGSNSYIENTGTGDLIIQDSGGDVRIKGKSNEDSIVANNDGSVDLYYDNSKKLATTSSGIDVTGDVDIVGTNTTDVIDASTLVSGTSLKINGNTSEGSDSLRMGAMANGTGDYFIDVSNGTGTASYNLLINPFNTGNVGIGTSSPSQELDISSANPAVRLTDTSTSGLYHEVVSYGNDLRFSADGGNVEGSTDIEFLIDGTEHLKIRSDGRGLSQFTAKAWVNFNGTGTVSIRDSHNVSSITDNGTGEWAANYSNSMSNANYSATTANSYVGGSYDITYAMISGYSTSNISFYTQQEDSGVVDVSTMNIQVFGD